MQVGGKLTAGLCNSMVSTAVFSTGLCLGACLTVWSFCVRLDTGVQVKWLLALMESLHLLDVYIGSAYCYSWPSYIKQTHQGMQSHFPRTVYPWLQNVSLLWQHWPQKPMHAEWLKITGVHLEAIMSCWELTEGFRTKVIYETGDSLMARKSYCSL